MRTAWIAAALFLLAQVAAAFDGPEHERLSNTALRAAIDVVQSEKIDRELLLKFASSPDQSFGRITAAADWFSTPYDDLLDPDTSVRNIEARLKIWNGPKRLWAKHRNVDHFQELALGEWRAHHETALDRARGGNLIAALQAEAVGLHYLQDFFAAGHAVTARTGMHDVAAGALHDQFNQDGLPFKQEEPIGQKQLAWLADERNSAHVSEAVRDAAKSVTPNPRFYGDGALDAGKAREQELFITTISAVSVTEVFEAYLKKPDERHLEVCFSPRVGRTVRDENTNSDTLQIAPIRAGARVIGGEANRVRCCSEGNWPTQFDLDGVEKVRKSDYEMSGIELRIMPALGRTTRDWRVDTELLFLGLVGDPKGALVDEEGNKINNPDAGSTVSVGPTFTKGQHYKAWGLMGYPLTYFGRGVTAGPVFGFRRYRWGEKSHRIKFDIGGTASYGFDIVNLSVTIQRAHAVREDGKLIDEWFGNAGLHVVVANSWGKFVPGVRQVQKLYEKIKSFGRSSPPAAAPSK
jgi:hypothetical protein